MNRPIQIQHRAGATFGVQNNTQIWLRMITKFFGNWGALFQNSFSPWLIAWTEWVLEKCFS